MEDDGAGAVETKEAATNGVLANSSAPDAQAKDAKDEDGANEIHNNKGVEGDLNTSNSERLSLDILSTISNQSEMDETGILEQNDGAEDDDRQGDEEEEEEAPQEAPTTSRCDNPNPSASTSSSSLFAEVFSSEGKESYQITCFYIYGILRKIM